MNTCGKHGTGLEPKLAKHLRNRVGCLLIVVLSFAPLSVLANADRLSELKEQLKRLDADSQRKLRSVERDFDEKMRNVNEDAPKLETAISALQEKLVALKNQHDPLAAQLGALQGQRDAIHAKYEKQITDTELQIKSTIAARDKYKTEMLVATAKLINDAIIINNLRVDLLPKDGTYELPDRIKEEDTDIAAFLNPKNDDRATTYCIGTIFQFETGGGRAAPYGVGVGDVQKLEVDRVPFEIRERGYGLTVLSQAKPERYYLRTYTVTFHWFPTALTKTSTARTFVSWAFAYINQLATYQRTINPKIVDSLKEERGLALRKWDYQNGNKLESIKQQFATLSEQIGTANQELSRLNAELAGKTSLIGKPRAEAIAEKRNEIIMEVENRRKAVLAQITFVEAELHKEQAQIAAEEGKRKQTEMQLAEEKGTTLTRVVAPTNEQREMQSAEGKAQLEAAQQAQHEEESLSLKDRLTVGVLVALVLVGVVLYIGLANKCPVCKRMWAARVLNRVATGQEEHWREERRVTEHCDTSGRVTGRSYTPYQQRYVTTHYKEDCKCKHCGHEWVRHRSRSRKAG